MRFCIVGAGFSGAIIARHLAEHGHKVLLVDERSHVAGNCHTERDPKTGVMLHCYGPHIFHTADIRVWNYVQRFGVMRPYINRVKAVSKGHVYSLPINLLTINQFFGTVMKPDEAKAFIKSKADHSITNPVTFEDQALSMIGPELYQAFFYGYTRKQWGLDPKNLPASILKRLPVRFNYDDNYFSHPYQGIPENGYTDVIKNILDVNGIEIRLNTKFEDIKENFQHIFYTGPIDRYFQFKLGRLGYRTLDFERFDSHGDYQGAAVINYCDEEIPYTRISEHKHFSPWEDIKDTTCFREYSRLAQSKDTPYYPIRLVKEKNMLESYIDLASQEKGVSFLGRLGTYRYLDMDVSIAEALSACDKINNILNEKGCIPPFFVNPL